jgi:hypothetical protein
MERNAKHFIKVYPESVCPLCTVDSVAPWTRKPAIPCVTVKNMHYILWSLDRESNPRPLAYGNT